MSREGAAEFLAGLWRDLTSIAVGDVALWLAVAAIVFLLVRLVRRWISRTVADINRRHQLRKTVGYLGGLVVLLFGIALFVGKFGHLATILGLIGAGTAIALQDLAKSAAGWVYLSSHPGYGPGARVEVGGVVGEVIDVGILKTTVLEVGGRVVHGRQSSGRLATIPNSRLLNDVVLLSPSYSPYTWNELQFLLTYESDWRRGVELLEGFGMREHERIEGEIERGFRELESRYAFKYGTLTPIAYVRAADSGVELTLRYMTHIRQRRGTADRITRAMVEAVEREPELHFAYPTMRIYRRGEGPGEGGGGPGSGPGAGGGPGGAGAPLLD